MIEFDNSTSGEAERFAARYVWAALLDWQVWLSVLIYMSIVGPRMLAYSSFAAHSAKFSG